MSEPRQDRAASASAPEAPPGPAASAAPHVAWLAEPQTFERFAGTLRPTAVALAMDELGRITALCPFDSDAAALPCPPVEALAYEPPWGGRLRPAAWAPLAAELRKRKIQLLHAFDAPSAAGARLLANHAELPYVVSLYAASVPRGSVRALQGAAAVLAAAEPIRAAAAARAAGAAARVLLPGVHQARGASCFSQADHDAAIVAGGRLDDFVAYAAVLQSFAELHERKYECVYFLIGTGRAEKSLRAQADKLGLRGVLQFVHCRPSRRFGEMLRGADVYVSPAAGEQVDMAALEAMADGVAVLAAHGVIGDFLVEGRTAMRFEAGHSPELTIKLISLLDDRAAAREMAETALHSLREAYSPTRAAASLVEVYRRAVEGGG